MQEDKVKKEDKENIVTMEKIGGGGQGNIYKAYHKTYDIILALKQICPEKQPKHIFKPERQLEIFNQLKNSNHIVTLMGSYQENGKFYMLFEFCAGTDLLKNRIKPNGKFTLSEYTIYRIFKQLLRAFKEIHSESIIHRDFKEDNIFLDAYGSIKLGDFGCSKIRDCIKDTLNVGNRFYRAPEYQLCSEEMIYPVSDIWGLGLFILHLIAGEEFIRSNYSQLTNYNFHHIYELIDMKKQMDQIFNNKWQGWEEVIKKMLQTDPKKRSTAQQLLEFIKEKQDSIDKWFIMQKYGKFQFLVEDQINSKKIIERISPYKKSKENKVRTDNSENQKRKKEQQTVYLALIQMRNFLHFQVERLVSWKKVLDFKNLAFERSYMKYSVIYICLNIYVQKLILLKEQFSSQIEKNPIFQEALKIIEKNQFYKQICQELFQAQKSTIEKEINKIKGKIQFLNKTHEEQVEQCKEMFENKKTSFEEKYKIYWKDSNSLQVEKKYKQIENKLKNPPECIKNWEKYDQFEKMQHYKEKMFFQNKIQPQLKSMRNHVFIELLFHLDQYLERKEWKNKEYLKMKTDQFFDLSHKELLKLHETYLKQ